MKGAPSRQKAVRGFDVSVLAVSVVVRACLVMSDSLATPQTVGCQASLSIGFSRQEY